MLLAYFVSYSLDCCTDKQREKNERHYKTHIVAGSLNYVSQGITSAVE